jgi:flagellar biogenesis protein FliO
MKSLLTLFFCIPAICISLYTPLQAETAQEVNTHSSEVSESVEKDPSRKETLTPGSAVIDRSHLIGSLKMSFIFLLVFGGIAYYFNKHKGSFKSSNNAQSALMISEEKSLGNGTSLVLLKVFDEYVLLSKHAGKVEFLKSFAGKDVHAKREGLSTKADHLAKKSELIPLVTSTSPEKIAHAIS